MANDDFAEQLEEIKNVIKENNNNFITDESLDTKLKEFAKTLKLAKDDSEPPLAENSSKERLLTEAKATEEFLDHVENCKDNNCGIHEMKDSYQKEAFAKGLLLGKKLRGKN